MVLCVVIEKSIVFSKKYDKNGPLYDLKKYIVWCVRRRKTCHDHHINSDSRPCNICIARLLKLGFKEMGYSDSDGNMHIMKLEEYKDGYYTYPQKVNLDKIIV